MTINLRNAAILLLSHLLGHMLNHILRVHSGFCAPDGGERLFHCPDCPCTFKKVGSLNSHRKRFHKIKRKKKKLAKGLEHDDVTDLPHSCSQCPRWFRRPSLLSRHLRQVHSKDFKSIEGSTTKRVATKDTESISEAPTKLDEEDLIVIDPSTLGMDYSQLTFESSNVLLKDSNATLQSTADTAVTIKKDEDNKTLLCEESSRTAQNNAEEASPCDDDDNDADYHQMANEETLDTFSLADGILPGVVSKEVAATENKQVEEQEEQVPSSVSEVLLDQVLKEEAQRKSQDEDRRDELHLVHVNKCGICSKSFKKPSDLRRHERTHTGEKPFQCAQCDRRFALRSTLTSHQLTHESEQLRRELSFSCHLCPLTFIKKCALKQHLTLHTGSKPYQCQECHRRFRTPALRKIHLLRCHGDSSEAPLPSVDAPSDLHISVPASSLSSALAAVSQIGVPLLGSTLKLQLDFGQENKVDEADNAVTQLKVDEALLSRLSDGGNINLVIKHPKTIVSQQGTVETTERTAVLTGEAPPPPPSGGGDLPESRVDEDPISASVAAASNNSCPVCLKKFKKPTQVRRHLCVHTGQRPHQCNLCGKSYTQRNSLLIHVRTVHAGERMFVCPFCAFSFSQKSNLTTHIERIHADQAKKLVQATGMESQ